MPNKKYAADVIVVGGGLAGVISAIIAARNGYKVILIEKGSCLGGIATASMLGEINGAYLNGEIVVSSIGEEIINNLAKREAALFEDNIPMTSNPAIQVDRVRYNSEYLKIVLDEMVAKENIQLFFCSNIKTIENSNNNIQITLTNLYEDLIIDGRVLIDSTGNSECIYMLREKTVSTCKDKKQAVTEIFKMGGVNIVEFNKLKTDEIQDIILKGTTSSILPSNIMSMLRVPGTNDIVINCTRCENIDHESIEDISMALIELRQQINRIIPFIKENVRGCKNAYLSGIASSIGVRDRRRIDGMYELTGDDLIACKTFKDSVAVGVYPVDLHVRTNKNSSVEFIKIGGNGIYKIPYRSMLTKTLDNVIANGKCIAADDVAFGAFRALGSIMNIATAAGAAASLAIKNNSSVKNVDIQELQGMLRKLGVKEI
ncbi:FAD-dependent oxidoreductase [Geosporobacter ferrireducens]|uniref:FAD-dependent oxidoreductase n=1 Tax=Geosporobacter ferrireducens TaxID=1424294 RepID=A0A1D8GEP9_9FIRM|nr:FAD-dependent oxidoreductase [Geosporobacter ferrireducens]AOT69392.1 hypothetical protein Gferi_07285 [Geosporobacter ferrireducens]MTI56503.1 FAD-dependent oxidoreductase [Geosporobacter ferrireducens]